MTAYDPAAAPIEDGYPTSAKVAAALAALFFPLISIIVALVLRSGETRPRRRSQLTTWAVAASGLILGQFLLALALFSAASSSTQDESGPCMGGPEIGAAGDQRRDGTTVFPCAISGTVTLRFP